MKNYDLTAAEFQAGINRIMAEALASSNVSEHPQIVFITSGPGAGKTSIETHCKKLFKEQGERAYSINSDKIAEYHPYYEDLVQELPKVCYDETRKFVRPATPKIFDQLMRNRINIINENVLNKGESDIELVKKLKNNGYRVIVDIIATDIYESRLSCYEREAAMLRAGLAPRGCSKETQQRMYNAFVPEVRELESANLCDELNVFIRGENISKPPVLRYSSGSTRYANFEDAINSERNLQRKQLLSSPAEYLLRIGNAKNTIQEYGVNPELTKNALSGLEELQADFIQELSKNSELGEK